jgi:hypothetical protein
MIKTLHITFLVLFNIICCLWTNFSYSQDSSKNNEIEVLSYVPSRETEKEILSYSITSCKYAVFQIGDSQLVDSRMNILKKHINNLKNDSIKIVSINVDNFTIHINGGRVYKQAIKGTNPGLIGELMITPVKSDRVVGCSKDDLFGGYILDEVPEGKENLNPLIVVIDISIKGKKYHSRTLSFTEDSKMKTLKKNVAFNTYIDDAIKKNTQILLDLITAK